MPSICTQRPSTEELPLAIVIALDMGSSLLLSLDSCLLINLLCPERRAGVRNVRRSRMKISITFWTFERNTDQELRVDLTPLFTLFIIRKERASKSKY